MRHQRTARGLLREVKAIATPFGYRRGVCIDDDILRELNALTLYVWGGLDPFAPAARADELAALSAMASVAHMPQCGHLPWMDDPDGVAGILGDFFRAHETTG
jgi:pimeloyl-ACP methyl ester carboxylesterase